MAQLANAYHTPSPVSVPYTEAILNRQRLVELERSIAALNDQITAQQTARASLEASFEAEKTRLTTELTRSQSTADKHRQNGKALFAQLQSTAAALTNCQRELTEARDQTASERKRADQLQQALTAATAAAAAAATTASATADTPAPDQSGPAPKSTAGADSASGSESANESGSGGGEAGKKHAASKFFAGLLSKSKSKPAPSAAAVGADPTPAAPSEAEVDSEARADAADTNALDSKSEPTPTPASAPAQASAPAPPPVSTAELLRSLADLDPDRLDVAPTASAASPDGEEIDVFVPTAAAVAATTANTGPAASASESTPSSVNPGSTSNAVPSPQPITPFNPFAIRSVAGTALSSTASDAIATGAGVQPFYSIRIIKRTEKLPLAAANAAVASSPEGELRATIDRLKAEQLFRTQLEAIRRAGRYWH